MTLLRIPTLATDRLVLRGHVAADLDATAALWADPEVTRFITGRPLGADEAWSRLLRHAGHWAHMGFGYWAVTLRDSGALIGEAGLGDWRRAIDPPLGPLPEAGWLLAPAWHGRGLASEALAAILGWADASLPAPRVVAIIDPAHAASIRVATRAGFHPAGMAQYRGGQTMVLSRPRGGQPPGSGAAAGA
jgi:RimJ/RimL family protein N-acetyltransferase